jgi:hypothetical protein
MITITCKKLAGRHDALTISAPGVTQVIRAWKQNILPHELVHFVAEETFGLRGFVRLVAAGHSMEFTGALKSVEALQAEMLTNALQYDLAGQVADEAAYRALVETVCAKDNLPCPDISDALITAARTRVHALNMQWQALPLHETLTVSMPL